MEKDNKNHGGARKGAGRPTKNNEDKQNSLFLKAIKKITNEENDDDAQVQYIVELAESERGRIWIADKYFGKPEAKVNHNNNGESFKNPFIVFGSENE